MPRVNGSISIPDNSQGKFLRDDLSWETPVSGAATIKSGLVNLAAGGSSLVTFSAPFSTIPQVVVSSQINNADTSCTYSVHSVTTDGFTLRGAGNPAGNVAWIATNAGNA